MSELENDFEVEQEGGFAEEVETEEVEEVEGSQDSESSELAPDSEAEHEQQPQDDGNRANQDKVTQVINRKHREMMEAKERADELQRRLQKYESEQQQQPPEILPKPDEFDDDFDEKLAAREQSIRNRALWEHENAQRQQLQQRQAEEMQRAQVEKLNAQAEKYSGVAKSLGVSSEELKAAASVVGSTGLSNDVAMVILEDEEGPLITKYLAANQIEAYDFAKMSPVQAGQYIERVIRPKLGALKPKQSSAPKPTTKVKQVNGDAEISKYPLLKGAKFE